MVYPLFGGALVAHLPLDAEDMSKVREIPDNQEVFAHVKTDQSILIDIMELVPGTDEEALRTHFEDLALNNNAGGSDWCVIAVNTLDRSVLGMKECSSAYWLIGQQRVSKFNEDAKNDISIHMVLFRLPQYATDILVTFNDPVNINPESSSHQDVTTSTVPWTVEDFKLLVNSLTLVDSGLFGE